MENKVYDNTNKGSLFYSEKKTEKHPDMTGIINVNGVEYQISGWKQISAKGNEYLTLKIQDSYKNKKNSPNIKEDIKDKKIKTDSKEEEEDIDDMPDFLSDL